MKSFFIAVCLFVPLEMLCFVFDYCASDLCSLLVLCLIAASVMGGV